MDDRCPKCGTVKRGAEACPRCGLVFAKYDPAAIAIEAPAELELLWRHAVDGWDDRARHALFVEKALSLGDAGYAAARYRSRGSDDAIAVEQLSRLSSRLEQEFVAASVNLKRSQADFRKSRSFLTIAVLLLATAIGFGLGILSLLRR